MDDLFGQAAKIAPDAGFLITADHGMNAKTRCWDLEQVCAAQNVPLRKAFSAGRDRYVKHNRGCSGAAYIYLRSPQDAPRVREILAETKGVERVLSREEAAREYRLMPSRIGHWWSGAIRTRYSAKWMWSLKLSPKTYAHTAQRTNGDIPLFVGNAKGVPSSDYFRYNLDLARWLYPA